MNRARALSGVGSRKNRRCEAPAVKVVSGRKRPRRAIARKRYDLGSKGVSSWQDVALRYLHMSALHSATASRERASGECRPGRIAIAAPSLRPFETGEGCSGVGRVVERFDQRLTGGADAVPGPHERGATEEGRLHGERIEALQATTGIDTRHCGRQSDRRLLQDRGDPITRRGDTSPADARRCGGTRC